MDTVQLKFMKNECFTLTMLGALGRSKTYVKSATHKEKEHVRKLLHCKLVEVAERYKNPVDEDEHVKNIREIADAITNEFASALRNGRFRIGIAQKCLNLYLKYLWCLGEIPEPPHCPFDGRIINKVLPKIQRLKWTELESEEDYLTLVGEARSLAIGTSLAKWELNAWNELK
jgi:hypothetical protein